MFTSVAGQVSTGEEGGVLSPACSGLCSLDMLSPRSTQSPVPAAAEILLTLEVPAQSTPAESQVTCS